MKKKIIRSATVSGSLSSLLQGQLRYMSQYFDVIAVASNGKNNELLKVSEQEGIPTYAVEMTRKITPFKDLVAVWKLYRLFKKEKPFIVHSHTPKAGTLSMIAAKWASIPHRLHTIAGLPLVEATGFKRIILNTVEKVTYACATKIYPNSYGLVDIILENKFTSKEKLKVIANGSSNGIDTSFFDPTLYTDNTTKLKFRAELGISNNDFVFIYVGRLVTDKGINELIIAFNKLYKQYNTIKLLLVGPYEKALDPLKIDTIEIINHNSNIISTGWVKDVRPYYSIANVLTFPSYREGFPNVVMQAAAMQLPCIVTNINGCNEIIKHNEYGIIIPIKDEVALYDAMIHVFNNQSKYKSMGINSRKHIQSYFERKVVWKAILDEYTQLS
ncbi:glycosyltransferase family 4 protein [Confluentibacter flavum]|uniref:Glycosyltransferase family 1 protein n=1 Tax=Confluentibacter flavum TaxID=1909700 RepID=A0A2N3HGG8_9FLAO|nr:glycosyltransferase family 4 protein [Confluentibacter flavum]PKQ44070.1 glycosyltransferase family 1 protein [Confluentibacter flavum]